MSSKVICIYAPDNGIRFFRKGIEKLGNTISSGRFQLYKLLPTKDSCEKAIGHITNASNDDLIIVISHGGDGYILPSRDAHVSNARYVTISLQQYVQSKKIICVACDSNSKSVKVSIEKGAIVFAGFGLIDFSCDFVYCEEEQGIQVERKTGKRPTRERYAKFFFREAVINSILYCIIQDKDFRNWNSVLRYFFDRYSTEIIFMSDPFGIGKGLTKNKRILIANFLQKMKHDFVIKGELSTKLLAEANNHA